MQPCDTSSQQTAGQAGRKEVSEFQVESYSYDRVLRGTWQGYRLDATTTLSDEHMAEAASDCIRLWLPEGTPMHWSTRTWSLHYNCLQFFWPRRWYSLSAFYEGRTLLHTYASIIEPVIIESERLFYVDLDLSMLVRPDLTYEVLNQAEYEQLSDTLHYSEDTRMGALMAMSTLANSISLGVGLFATIPHLLRETEFHLTKCS